MKTHQFPINRAKSGIRKPTSFTVLGFGFVPTYVKGERSKYQLVVSQKSWEKLKQKLKLITRKTTPMSFDERIEKLIEVQRGWINNFRLGSIYVKLKKLVSSQVYCVVPACLGHGKLPIFLS